MNKIKECLEQTSVEIEVFFRYELPDFIKSMFLETFQCVLAGFLFIPALACILIGALLIVLLMGLGIYLFLWLGSIIRI